MIDTCCNPRIYVACLASYNNGILYGKWIDAAQPYNDLIQEVKEMLSQSPEQYAEEWAIHDYDDFYSITISEWQSLETVSEIATALKESDDPELFANVYDYLRTENLDDVKEFIEENYEGLHKDLEDYAYNWHEMVGDLSGLPETILRYIDFKAIGRDMEASGHIIYFTTYDYNIHVFRS